ncbi:hypothetical protein RR46_07117 [Papilio xuthus]|uniref:Uncharacterized protein n=1 Tax=Papilio xuthus TaxID=66420 RepID=A0A194Q4Q7_PAPXU|nr:hypothetical protein RR46_07117 [Papilio xuthus]
MAAMQQNETQYFQYGCALTSEHEEQPGPEFVSAGVSLFVGSGGCGGGGVLYRQRAPPRAPAHLVPPATHDRLWMWRCFNYT